jgi:predicted GIY-YIG superfamily endonuclease
LAFQKNLGTKSLALRVERRVKRMSKARKEKLITLSGYADRIVIRSKR